VVLIVGRYLQWAYLTTIGAATLGWVWLIAWCILA
jgi:hypothetical protein